MNGLHSKKKLRSAYPQFDDRILRHIYSGLPPSGRRLRIVSIQLIFWNAFADLYFKVQKNRTAVNAMQAVDFDEFTNTTRLGLISSLKPYGDTHRTLTGILISYQNDMPILISEIRFQNTGLSLYEQLLFKKLEIGQDRDPQFQNYL